MVLERAGAPLVARDLPAPEPGPRQVLVRVDACGVCRTDLHVADGELSGAALPLVLGHEVVGRVVARGDGALEVGEGERVGVPWLGWTCGECTACQRGQENLCPRARFTGYTLDGGYAELVLADARYVLPLPERFDDAHAAPLLCAGLIGFRALGMAGEAERLGLYGFGAAAHVLAQLALHEGRSVFAFTRPGDVRAQAFARSLGVTWVGGSDEPPPEPLDAALLFAPVGALVPAALRAVRPGGTVVCGGIHMSDIPSFPYELLWGERVVRSVANLTRSDGSRFLGAIADAPIATTVEIFPLEHAGEALSRLRRGELHGAAVLVPAAH